jgi:phage gp37-like protein
MPETRLNGVVITQPTVYVAFVAYGDTSNPANFVIVHRIVQVGG